MRLTGSLGLIGNIYDAALDRSVWPLVMEQTCGYVEGCASSLMSQDFVHRSGQFYYSWGDDPHYTKLYFEKYQKINPFAVPMAAHSRDDDQRFQSSVITVSR